MSVQAGDTTRTEPQLMSFAFNSHGQATLREIEVVHGAIRALVAAGMVAARAEHMSHWSYGEEYPTDEPYVVLKDVIDQSLADAGDSAIRSIKLSNPYELIATITGGTLAATMVVQRCVVIFDNIQRSRLSKALTDRALLILRDEEIDAFRARNESERQANLEQLAMLVAQIGELAGKHEAEVKSLDGS